MHPEPITQNEVSQKEKSILTYIHGIQKDGYWWTYLQGNNGDADIDNRLVDTVGEEERETNWESSTETYTLPYVK